MFERIFNDFYKFGIVIFFHIHAKVTHQYDWHICTTSPCQKLKHFEHPAKLENIEDFRLSLGVFGDTYRVTTSTFCLFIGHSDAQMSPHEFEAGNLNDVLAMFCLSSFMRRRGIATVAAALSICL
jgi:hypothetical protein